MVSKVQKTSPPFSQCGLRCSVAVLLLAVVFFSGCHWMRSDGDDADSAWKIRPIWKRRQAEQGSVAPIVSAQEAASQPNSNAADDKAPQNNTAVQVEQLLTVTDEITHNNGQKDTKVVHGWYREAAHLTAKYNNKYRWRHNGLELWHNMPPPQRPPLAEALRSKNAFIRNAAIIELARLEGRRHIKPLLRVIQTPINSLHVRRAAIETLSHLQDPLVPGQLVILIDDDNRPKTADGKDRKPTPGLQAELVRALVLYVRPQDDRRFLAALESPSIELQIEALTVLTERGDGPLPDRVKSLISSQQSPVSIAALRAVGACRHTEATESVIRATHDSDLGVRLMAVETLGRLGGEKAIDALQRIYTKQGTRFREVAIIALARAGDTQIVRAAANDRSWRIRRAAAGALAFSGNGSEAVELAQQLLSDYSSEVRLHCIESIARWPLPLCGPLLLKATGSTSTRIRMAALNVLMDRWPTAGGYKIQQFEDHWAAAIAQLRQNWRDEFGELVDRPASPQQPQYVSATIEPRRLDEVQQNLERLRRSETVAQRERESQSLVRFGNELAPALEQLWRERKVAIPEGVFRNILPKLSPAFESIEQLSTPDVALRRRAAAQLADQARSKGLTPLALHRLDEVAGKEADPLVWRHLLDCLNNQSGEAAQRLAYAALWQDSPEVRRRACPFFEANGSPQHLDALLPLLHDPSSEVVTAATRAVSSCGPLKNPAPLLQLLASPHKTLRIEAAAALVRLGFSAGSEAMERLSYDLDSNTRRRTVEAIGDLADPLFLPILIRMLDDRDSVSRAALAALPQLAAEDITAGQNPRQLSTAEKVQLWKQWYQNGGEIAATSKGDFYQSARHGLPRR